MSLEGTKMVSNFFCLKLSYSAKIQTQIVAVQLCNVIKNKVYTDGSRKVSNVAGKREFFGWPVFVLMNSS